MNLFSVIAFAFLFLPIHLNAMDFPGISNIKQIHFSPYRPTITSSHQTKQTPIKATPVNKKKSN
jgi:hypothetical protein